MTSKFFVYVYVDHDSGYPIYVGKGCGQRDTVHINIAKRGDIKGHLYHWIRKYHATNNKWPIPFRMALGMDEETAFELEKGLIRLYGRQDLGTGSLFNLSEGGSGSAGYKRGKLSPETIAKRTQSVLGRKNTPETIEKMRRSATGRKMSPEAVVKIVKAVKSRPPISDETRAKLSAAAKGKVPWCKGMKLSEQTRKRMSESHKARFHT